MNIYVHEKGILLTGKAWEVRQKIKCASVYFRPDFSELAR